MNEFPLNDDEFEDKKITNVKKMRGNEYEVAMGCLCLSVESPKIVPIPGDVIRTYGSFGRPVRGVFINGKKVYYRTVKEEDERQRSYVEEVHKEQRDTFEKNRDKMDAAFDALPEIFQRRILRYRTNNPDFRWKYEAYEVFCCEQAVAIADALKTADAISNFARLSLDEQKDLVPSVSGDHSGNTFGTACRLATMYVTMPEYIPLDHGAMAALVGCEEFGCPPVSQEEIERVEKLYK